MARKSLVFALLIALCPGSALSNEEDDRERRPKFELSAYTEDWVRTDRNGDGTFDHAALLNDWGKMKEEAADFNYDGKMDDFLFYSDGVLMRQEVDSNYDGRIDLWVYVEDGIYVGGYERDTDHDGRPDVVKDYGSDGDS